MSIKRLPYTERGAAALIVVVVLLAVLTLTTLSLSSLSRFEVRVAADSNREKEAFSAAQAGLDLAAMRYLADTSAYTSKVTSSGVTLNSAPFTYTVSTSSESVDITSQGSSVDGTGGSTVAEKYGMATALGFGEVVPYMAAATIPTSGTFTLVANPNAGGDGIPVSAWSEGAGTGGTASWQTCNLDEYKYLGGNDCSKVDPDKMLCNSKTPETDCDDFVIDECVPDALSLLLGIDMPSRPSALDSSKTCGGGGSIGAWADYKKDHKKTCQQVEDFDFTASEFKAGPFGAPLAWVEGDCALSKGVGTASHPLVLIVEGNLTLGPSDFYGVFVGFSPGIYSDPEDSSQVYTVDMNGGATVYGSVMVMGNLATGTTGGSSSVIYSKDVLDKLSNGGEGFSGLARIKGTWHDF